MELTTGIAFPRPGQCEGGTPGSYHSEGLCLDAGHRPLVSRGGMQGSPHQASWASVQTPLALLFPSGKIVGGKEA